MRFYLWMALYFVKLISLWSYLFLYVISSMISDFFTLYREQLLQDKLRQEQDSLSNMKKIHEIAQSQLFELRAQSGNMLIPDFYFFIFNYCCNIILKRLPLCFIFLYRKHISSRVVWHLYHYFPDEEKAAKQAEVNLLMDEVERAQTRLRSLEREKVCSTTCILILSDPTCLYSLLMLIVCFYQLISNYP